MHQAQPQVKEAEAITEEFWTVIEMTHMKLLGRPSTFILCLLVLSGRPATAGILDSFNWGRADKIEVNIPWLPCEYFACYRRLLRSVEFVIDYIFGRL